MTWALGFFAALTLCFVLASALSAYGSHTWRVRTRRLHQRLAVGQKSPVECPVNSSSFEEAPAVVRRYFRAALVAGRPPVTSVEVEHAGTFNLGEARDQWRRFVSKERIVTKPRGFVWNGDISWAPGVPIRVHDAYVAGEGILHAALLGVFPVADLCDTGTVATGELVRFLVEAAWYPSALLPGQGVKWHGVDDTSAVATLEDSGLRTSALFRFDADGLIASVHVDHRARTVQGRLEPTPWEGNWWNYQIRNGIRIPIDGEVAWLLPNGRKAYWRGHITRVEHSFAT